MKVHDAGSGAGLCVIKALDTTSACQPARTGRRVEPDVSATPYPTAAVVLCSEGQRIMQPAPVADGASFFGRSHQFSDTRRGHTRSTSWH